MAKNYSTIRQAFTLKDVEAALAMGKESTNELILKLIDHVKHLEGIEYEAIESGWIIKSITAVRTKYHLITHTKLKTDILWHDGSADTDTYTVDVTAKIMLRLFSVLENTHQ